MGIGAGVIESSKAKGDTKGMKNKQAKTAKKMVPMNNSVKSPSDTTIYIPGLARRFSPSVNPNDNLPKPMGDGFMQMMGDNNILSMV